MNSDFNKLYESDPSIDLIAALATLFALMTLLLVIFSWILL